MSIQNCIKVLLAFFVLFFARSNNAQKILEIKNHPQFIEQPDPFVKNVKILLRSLWLEYTAKRNFEVNSSDEGVANEISPYIYEKLVLTFPEKNFAVLVYPDTYKDSYYRSIRKHETFYDTREATPNFDRNYVIEVAFTNKVIDQAQDVSEYEKDVECLEAAYKEIEVLMQYSEWDTTRGLSNEFYYKINNHKACLGRLGGISMLNEPPKSSIRLVTSSYYSPATNYSQQFQQCKWTKTNRCLMGGRLYDDTFHMRASETWRWRIILWTTSPTSPDDNQVGYKAAFLTANLEGGSYTEEEIKGALLSANRNIVKLDDYDVLFIGLQEASSSMTNIKIDLPNHSCSVQYKTGFTKFPYLWAMVSVVCYKNEKFDEVAEENPAGFGWRLKGGVGKCVTPKIGDDIVYCFLNLHLDTSPMDGASRLVEALEIIENKEKVSPVQKVVIYAVGDWNLRVFPNYKPLTNVESAISLIKNDMVLLREGNSKTENMFIEKFSQLMGDQKGSKNFSASFPPSNLDSLPLTYKYAGNELDYKNILNTKPMGDEGNTELNNLGWLDRLGCLWSVQEGKCSIENLEYAAKPDIMKGDHLPLVGSFEFSQTPP